MAHLGRGHPQNTYHLIVGPVASNIFNIGNTDFISSIDNAAITVTPSSSDTGAGIDNNKLFVTSSENGTFFDTSTVFISFSNSDIAFSSTSENFIIPSNNQCFSAEANSVSVTLASLDVVSSVDTNTIFISNSENISSSENVLISFFSTDTSSSTDSSSVGSPLSSSDTMSSTDQGSVANSILNTDIISSIDNGVVGYTLFSTEVGTGTDSQTVVNNALSVDSGLGVEQLPAIKVSSSDTGIGQENPGSNFFSADTGTLTESTGLVSTVITSKDTITSLEVSVSTVGSSISLLWNINVPVTYRVFSLGKLVSRSA